MGYIMGGEIREFPRPKVLVSRCLEFENVRYDGHVIRSQIVKDLEPYVDYIKVCPEVEIGLGIPRDPIRIVKINGRYKLIQPRTNRDITEKMDKFTDDFLDKLQDVDGFIFKSGSPTIGYRNIKVYSGIESATVIEKGSGFFAAKILKRYNGYPVEENDRLRNSRIRHHFLTYLFAFTEFRRIKSKESIDELIKYHKKHHYLFLTYNIKIYNEMESLIKNCFDIPTKTLFDNYEYHLKDLFSNPPVSEYYLQTANTIFSQFSSKVPQSEIEYFNQVLDKYKQNLITLHGLIEILKLYVLRFDNSGIKDDRLFQPYPIKLQPAVDEDRDKDYWK
jgi:uncharacterized protein YbbK (DUF523 family)/uncharacterized protein YbgA (DUF1722 family)